MRCYVFRPFELHECFALTTSGEDATLSEFQHALNAVLLEIEQKRRQLSFIHIKPATLYGNLFAL